MKGHFREAGLALAILCSAVAATATMPGRGPEAPARSGVEVILNTDEAEAVLAILRRTPDGSAVEPALWDRLFSCEPYVRLKKREAAIAKMFNAPEIIFTDEDFRKFVLSDDLKKRAPELDRTLAAWRKADLAAAGERVLAFLPAEARIRAKVFPVIKPHRNSFVFELATDPTVFLYLDPDMSEAQFESTVAHEMHHIGLSSLDPLAEKIKAGLPPRVRTAFDWLGAFGEGQAMLAAAGGPNVHPHATSPAEDQARWDRDMAGFDSDLKKVQGFFMDILQGRLTAEKEIAEKGSEFFGIQGPWYTVGYKMAVTVETAFGRARLIKDMIDPRRLLEDYNRAAETYNRDHADRLALWSAELLDALNARSGA